MLSLEVGRLLSEVVELPGFYSGSIEMISQQDRSLLTPPSVLGDTEYDLRRQEIGHRV